MIQESAFDKKIKNSGLKFNPGLALTGVRTTGPRLLLRTCVCRQDSLGLPLRMKGMHRMQFDHACLDLPPFII